MAENHGNIDTKNVNLRLEVEKYPMHTEYKLQWHKHERVLDDINMYLSCWVDISTRSDTFVVSMNGFPNLTINNELCQDPHNMTIEDWTLLTMLYPQITTQYWNILKLLKDFVDKPIEEEYLIENVKCILKGETN